MCVMAAGVRTWEQRTLKFWSPSLSAWRIARAVGGVVVSKPMAKKTTSRPGLALASFSASSGEYTIRMSAPRALARISDKPSEAGTRMTSP
jgi:hypothetical protein